MISRAINSRPAAQSLFNQLAIFKEAGFKGYYTIFVRPGWGHIFHMNNRHFANVRAGSGTTYFCNLLVILR